MPSLKHALEESHKDIMQWFLLHQECLLLDLRSSSDRAIQAFDVFTAMLRMHLDFENNYLLKEVSFLENRLRWKANVYQKEHDKLLAMVDKIMALLSTYQKLEGRKKRLALLDVLDFEQSLKHVLEHHEEREEQDLFQFIDELDETHGGELLHRWQELDVTFTGSCQDFKQLLQQALASS